MKPPTRYWIFQNVNQSFISGNEGQKVYLCLCPNHRGISFFLSFKRPKKDPNSSFSLAPNQKKKSPNQRRARSGARRYSAAQNRWTRRQRREKSRKSSRAKNSKTRRSWERKGRSAKRASREAHASTATRVTGARVAIATGPAMATGPRESATTATGPATESGRAASRGALLVRTAQPAVAVGGPLMRPGRAPQRAVPPKMPRPQQRTFGPNGWRAEKPKVRWYASSVRIGLFCENVIYGKVNPFTPKSDRFRISPAAPTEIYITQYEELGFS